MISRIKTDKRIQLTKLRLSDHDLMIERGRYLKIDIPKRTCPLCNTTVEDEIHFTLQCPALTHLRDEYFLNMTEILPTFDDLSESDKFFHIMNPITSTVPMTTSSIYHITEERQRILQSLVKDLMVNHLLIEPTEEQITNPLKTMLLLNYA